MDAGLIHSSDHRSAPRIVDRFAGSRGLRR